jgi:O-antigen ligase
VSGVSAHPLVLLVAAALATLAVVAIEPKAVVAVAAMPAAVAVAVLAWSALNRRPLATLALVFAMVFLTDAVFRVREYQDKDVDFQVLLKLAVWTAIAAVALCHAKRWVGAILTPTNLPWLMLLAWLFVTAAVSQSPAYSAVAAFSILACVLFCAYAFATIDRIAIFSAVIAAIVVFCLISIVLYFAVPEFGRYVYWLNEQRYVSNRLSGIAGSANNMGRLAAFGLVIIGIYARELHAANRWFVPVGALIMAAALVMTNSRTSMMMVVVILGAFHLLTRQRLYIAVFAVSLALVSLAAILPAGDDALRVISRSGSIEEVASFTGRTDIWYAVAKLAEAKPWTGFGYASSVFVLPQHEREVGFLTSHAHNVVLQLLLTTGWVGVGLFLLSILSVGLRAIILGDRATLAILSFVLLNGITESSGFTTLANICSIAFAMAVTLPPERRVHEIYRPYQRRFS